MATEIILICFGIGIGAVIVIFAWQMHDKAMWKEIDDALNHSDFCEVGCGYYENCYSRNEDPDDANYELINNYCPHCPIEQAREIAEKHLK